MNIDDIKRKISTMQLIIDNPTTMSGERQAAQYSMDLLKNKYKALLQQNATDLKWGTHILVHESGIRDAKIFVDDYISMIHFIDEMGQLRYHTAVKSIDAYQYLLNLEFKYFCHAITENTKLW